MIWCGTQDRLISGVWRSEQDGPETMPDAWTNPNLSQRSVQCFPLAQRQAQSHPVFFFMSTGRLSLPQDFSACFWQAQSKLKVRVHLHPNNLSFTPPTHRPPEPLDFHHHRNQPNLMAHKHKSTGTTATHLTSAPPQLNGGWCHLPLSLVGSGGGFPAAPGTLCVCGEGRTLDNRCFQLGSGHRQ